MESDNERKIIDEGKKVKIIKVGKKGEDIMSSELRELMKENVDMSEVKKIDFVNEEKIGKKIIKMFEEGDLEV